MHCSRCHHTDEAHGDSDESSSIMRLGACQIPGCTCGEYADSIKEIDEELL